MAEMLYRIHWKLGITGETWRGLGAFPQKVAQQYVDEMNADRQNMKLSLRCWIEPEPVEAGNREGT